MPVSIQVNLTDSYHRKTNKNTIIQALTETIRDTCLKAENECKKTCPVDTGRLKAGHSTITEKLEGQVTNSVEYAGYVINGTSKMDAQNYPQEVANTLATQEYISQTFHKHLKSKGVLD